MNRLPLAVIALLLALHQAQAAVPHQLSYQGYLAGADGQSVDATTTIVFSIYTAPTGGMPLWSEIREVTPDNGLFSVQLGGVSAPFPAGLFSTPLWVGLTAGDDGEMQPRRALTSVGFAFAADDAMTLQGQTPTAFDQSADVAALQAQLDAALADIAALQAAMDGVGDALGSLSSRVTATEAADVVLQVQDALLQADIDANSASIAAAQASSDAALADVDTAITVLEANSVLELDGFLTLDGDVARFDGINVQIVNGTGQTDMENGYGNLIVGYNAMRALTDDESCSDGSIILQPDCTSAGETWRVNHRSGSHNVVIGDQMNFSRHSGLVSGTKNAITGDGAAALGGSDNQAGNTSAVVAGGRQGLALGDHATVVGGDGNEASGLAAAVTGGSANTASGNYASVSGGGQNVASATRASVTGGRDNVASGNNASVSGGQARVSPGADDWSAGSLFEDD